MLGFAVVVVVLIAVRGECPEAPAQEQARGQHHTNATAGATDFSHAAPRVERVEPQARVARSRRNLFAYSEVPRVVTPAPVAQPVVAVAAPQPVVVEAPARVEPAPPPFPYRYIGRFGPRHDPIAAFAGADRIVTARPGDRIDEQFVLRAIGLESVEVEARGWEQRIPVGLSAPI